MFTGKGINTSSLLSYYYNGDDLIKEKDNLKHSDASNCSKDIVNASREILVFKIKFKFRFSFSRLQHLINLKTTIKHANSLLQMAKYLEA